jgi:hypothetical protein
MQKKIILFCFLIFMQHQIVAQDLLKVRNLFYRSVKSSQAADSLQKILQHVNTLSQAELQGYKAMSTLMICYHSYNPYVKFNNFLEGKKQLEQAIQKDPSNLELRFLRLTTQLNTPSFLGYNGNINEDKQFILNRAKTINDPDLFKRMYDYTLTVKKLGVKDRKALQQALYSNKLSSTIKQ